MEVNLKQLIPFKVEVKIPEFDVRIPEDELSNDWSYMANKYGYPDHLELLVKKVWVVVGFFKENRHDMFYLIEVHAYRIIYGRCPLQFVVHLDVELVVP